jgi:hypothetical protein
MKQLQSSKNLSPLGKKFLRKLYARPLPLDDLFTSMDLNDFSFNRQLRSLITEGWIEKDTNQFLRVHPEKKERILQLLSNKKENKYTIHKIINDCTEMAADGTCKEAMDFAEIELSDLNYKILESKIKELKDFASKLQLLEEKNHGPTKTYYFFQGIVSDSKVREHVDSMYIN